MRDMMLYDDRTRRAGGDALSARQWHRRADRCANPRILEIGKAELLRDGGEIAIVAYGSMVHPSLQAAENLAKDGIEATVINARFVKPLDSGLLLALARTKRLIVTVEEAYLAGGFGSAVLELLEENGLQDKVRVVRMGVPDRIVTHGDPKLLLAKYGLDADGIYTRVKEAVEVLEDRRAKHQKVHRRRHFLSPDFYRKKNC